MSADLPAAAVTAVMDVLATHRWKSMGVASVECECGAILYGPGMTQFPADEAFRRHLAEAVLGRVMTTGRPADAACPVPDCHGHDDGATLEQQLSDHGLGQLGVSAALAIATDLRTQLEHAKAALAGDHEGIRLWMLDCAELTAKHRADAEAAREEAGRAAADERARIRQLAIERGAYTTDRVKQPFADLLADAADGAETTPGGADEP